MDELAAANDMDQVELRLKNYADRNDHYEAPWSTKELRACYLVAAERFGWPRRSRPPRSAASPRRDGVFHLRVRGRVRGSARRPRARPHSRGAHGGRLRREALFVPGDDRRFNPLGVKGLAEIAVCGVAPAIVNAAYHATGTRIRELPLTLDKLLG